MKKRIIIFSLSLALALSTAPSLLYNNDLTIVHADEAESETNSYPFQYKNCNDHIEIIGSSNVQGMLSIPEEIDGLPITIILPGAFKDAGSLSEVFLPITVEEIGDEAFAGCCNLRSVHFSPVLRSIGKRAFYNCSRIKVMILPDTVQTIGEEAFAECSLQNVILPDSLKRIEKRVFLNNSILDTISIPAGVDRIERSAFEGCNALQHICYKGSANSWDVLSIAPGNESLTQAELLCDYNKQIVNRSCSFDPDRDTWAFLNKDVGYYVLSDEKLAEMTQGMSDTEKAKVYSFWESIKDGEYRGVCAGMAATSMLAAYGILDPSELDPDAECLHDVVLTDEVRELLTYYLVLQSSDSFFEGDVFSDFKLYYYLEHGLPVYCSYYATLKKEGQLSRSGHAVIAYGVEDGLFEFDGTVFTKRILTYDSNVDADSDRDGCIYWGQLPDSENPLPEIMVYVPYQNERGMSRIIENPEKYSIDALNLHGMNKGSVYSKPSENCALLRSLQLPAEYTVQRAEPDGFESINNYEVGTAGLNHTILFPDAETNYGITLNDPQELDCSMSYEHFWYAIDGSQIGTASFSPDGSVSVKGQDAPCTITMVSDEGYHSTSFYEVSISGENMKEMKLSGTVNGYMLEGDQLKGITIQAVNENTTICLSFTTPSDRVLISELDENCISVLEDTDKDGIFETILVSQTEYSIGDVNGDGSVNASDAASVLIYAAEYGATGSSQYLNAMQCNRADLNEDGYINSSDAASILQYAALVGSGAKLEVMDFIHQYKGGK